MVSRNENRPTMRRSSHTAGDQPLILAIALQHDERIRLAGLLDGFGPLVLLSSVEEAHKLLDRRQRTSAEPLLADLKSNGSRAWELAGVRIDSDLLVATRNQHRVELTPLENDLLVCLGSEPRRTWTHAALHESVWNTHHPGRRADIHSAVKRLRRKLAELGAPIAIEAIRGVGYRLGDLPESASWAVGHRADADDTDADAAQARFALMVRPESRPGLTDRSGREGVAPFSATDQFA